MKSLSIRHRVLLIALAIALMLSVSGAAYQALMVRNESLRFPPPGRLIQVAGDGARKLHLICLGEGQPTVIFESAGFTNALSFSAARQEVSLHMRVCSYDRMGMGWSDPGPEVISAGLLADDLDGLTRQAHLQPPFILVPSSLGGLTAELFARRHPDRVAGLVFVDAANSSILEAVNARFSPVQISTVCMAKTAARFGVLRLLDPFGFRKEQSEEAARSMSRLYRVEPMQTLCGLARGQRTTTAEFEAAPPLAPEIPLHVLVHEKPYGFLPPRLANVGFLAEKVATLNREWLDLQQRFARTSRRGTWSIVPASNHLIASSQPHAVASSILEMLAEIRTIR